MVGSMHSRMDHGKYALVRTAPSVDPAYYISRAQALGLTGLIFMLNDKDSLLAEWKPDAAGADWQRLQYMLGPGGGVGQIRGVPTLRPDYGGYVKIGVMFDAGRGAYEVPEAEGTSWAAIMNLLDPLGRSIDFYMADITVEPRWAVYTEVLRDVVPYGTSAKKLCTLIAASRWASQGRPRPIFVITPAEPITDWPGVMWDGDPAHYDYCGAFAPGCEWSCAPVINAAHRLDPANGTSDISAAWSWHQTYAGYFPFRGEALFDLRTTTADTETVKGMVQSVIGYTTMSLANCDTFRRPACWWRPRAGLVVFDDLAAIDGRGFAQAVQESAEPVDFWNLNFDTDFGGGACNETERLAGLIVWPLEQPVRPLIAGQPWELTLMLENWRYGYVGRLMLSRPSSHTDYPCPERYGPCDAEWLQVWHPCPYGPPCGGTAAWVPITDYCVSGSVPMLEECIDYDYIDHIDPWQSWPAIRLRGTPTNSAIGFYHMTIKGACGAVVINWDDCLRFSAVVAPASPVLKPIIYPSAAADSFRALPAPHLHEVWAAPFIDNGCMPIPLGPGPAPVLPPTPGGFGDCGQTTVFVCPDGTYEVCNSIINLIWTVAGRDIRWVPDWEEMAFYIAVLFRESGNLPTGNAAGDCCPEPALDCTRCITCAASDKPTTCCCSFGLFMLNKCGGQGGSMSCAQLLDPATNASIAMIAMKSAWLENKAAGYTGFDLYKRVAADSGHPGSTPEGELSRQWIARFTQCVAQNPLVLPLPTFGLVWPLHGALNADCAWHMQVEKLSAIDINCTPGTGGETIRAAHNGYVRASGLDPRTAADSSMGYGYTVEIEDKTFSEYVTKYGHMQAGSLLVSVGDEVAAGDPIGLCGSTGNSTGPHLHFELRHNGVTICPCAYLEGGC